MEIVCVRTYETFLAITLNINLIFVCHLYFACHSIFIPLKPRFDPPCTIFPFTIDSKEEEERETVRMKKSTVDASAQIGTNEQEKRRRNLPMIFSLSLSWFAVGIVIFYLKTKSLRCVAFFCQAKQKQQTQHVRSYTFYFFSNMLLVDSFFLCHGFADTPLACSQTHTQRRHLNA